MRYVLMLCIFLLFLLTASGQTKAPDTLRDYNPDSSSSISNCSIYQIKMLHAVIESTDISQQQLYLNSASAYGSLSKLGAEC